MAAGRSSISSLIDHVSTQIVEILEIDRCRFDSGTAASLAVLNSDGTMTRAGHTVDVDRHGLPSDTEIALMAGSGGVIRGRFLLTAATRVIRPSLEQLRVAVALADQVGAALIASNPGRA